MYLNKFLKYLTTEKGRAFTMHSVCVASLGLFCANYVPNTFLIDKFKTVLQAYKYCNIVSLINNKEVIMKTITNRHGEEREVTDKLQRRFELAMGLCRCTEIEKNFLKPFIAFGFDTIHIGRTL